MFATPDPCIYGAPILHKEWLKGVQNLSTAGQDRNVNKTARRNILQPYLFILVSYCTAVLSTNLSIFLPASSTYRYGDCELLLFPPPSLSQFPPACPPIRRINFLPRERTTMQCRAVPPSILSARSRRRFDGIAGRHNMYMSRVC